MSENLSKARRMELEKGIDAVRDFIESAPQDNETRKLLNTMTALQKELFEKKYGLVFERHCESVDELVEGTLPIAVCDEDLTVKGEGPVNAIIEGDNLISLGILQRTLKGKVDLIYIDPNYNTGSHDFRYDDAFVDKNDLFAHSKWLSFMEPRLRKARSLLAPDGAIFISIDDREQAPLKLLCDEVFGANCFVGCVSWQKTYSPKNDSGGLPTEVEYILIYSRFPSWSPKRLARTADMDDRYGSPDNDPRAWTSGDAAAQGASNHRGMVYAIQHPITGVLLYPANGRHWVYGQAQMLAMMEEWAPYHLEEIDDLDKRATICGASSEDMSNEGQIMAIMLDDSSEQARAISMRRYEKGSWPKLYFTSGGEGGIRCKRYLDEVEGKLPTNLWPFAEVGHTDGAKKELKALFDGVAPFDTPKPTTLIKRILDIAAPKDAIVVDFFAGSGSTGHAVSDKNVEDGGTRRYILCTNNEENICSEVTYPRCKKVLETPLKYEDKEDIYRKELTFKSNDFKNWSEYAAEAKEAAKKARPDYDHVSKPRIENGELVVYGTNDIEGVKRKGSLKYYRAETIPFDEGDVYNVSEELLDHIRSLIEIENGVDLASDPSVAAVLTEKEADELFSSNLENIETVYIGHDVLLTAEQLDAIASHAIRARTVPAYYYSEVGD